MSNININLGALPTNLVNPIQNLAQTVASAIQNNPSGGNTGTGLIQTINSIGTLIPNILNGVGEAINLVVKGLSEFAMNITNQIMKTLNLNDYIILVSKYQ